ncbi:MAG: ABC transporter permease, partial [Vicinamibacteria bacterium]
MRELRYAIRQLVSAPGYAVIAVLTLALGMGATTAFFSVLYGVVLRPPDYPDANGIVSLINARPETVGDGDRFARAELVDVRSRQRAFSAIGGATLGRRTLNGDADGFAERVKVSEVTPEVFGVLGVPAALGRTFSAADVGAGRLAVISDSLWRTRFGAARDTVGRTVRLNDEPFTVVGVMPPGFAYPEGEMAAWLALDLRREPSDRNDRELFTVARLAPGVSLDQSRDDLARVARDLQQAQPADYPAGQWTLGVESLRARQFGHLQLRLAVLFAAAGSVLLIACVNVAIMALLRAVARRRELSIRLAVGASRGAIARQLLTEAGVIATLGAVAGTALASFGISVLVAYAPAGIPRVDRITLDLPAALFTIGLLVVVTLVVGSAPALVAMTLRGSDGILGSNRVSDSRATGRLRDGLTIAEVALAAALVIGAGLTLRSLQGLLRDDVGFTTTNRVSFKTNLTAQAYPDAARVAQFYDQVSARLAATPGVRRLGAISYVPMSREGNVTEAVPETPAGTPARTPVVRWSVVRGQYFETMGIALLRGRYFADSDTANAPLVAIVDEQLAERWWQRADAAIGQRVRVGSGTRTQVRTIVGVVHRVSHNGPGDTPLPALYAPQAQLYQRGMYTVIETSEPPATVFAAARAALAAVDPAVPLYFAETSDRRYDDVVALPRFIAGLVSGFSTIALVLAGVGIFGVTGYAVSQRRREFGIRLALGAQRSGIGGLVLRRVAGLVGVGIIAGVGVALALGSTIGSLLFGVQPDDPATFALAAGTLALTAMVAAIAPMRAAVRVDPAVTLKA